MKLNLNDCIEFIKKANIHISVYFELVRNGVVVPRVKSQVKSTDSAEVQYQPNNIIEPT